MMNFGALKWFGSFIKMLRKNIGLYNNQVIDTYAHVRLFVYNNM